MKYDIPLELDNKNSAAKIIKRIKENSIILEFGSANGRMTKYLKSTMGCKIYIVEVDKVAYEDAIEFAENGVNDDIMSFSWIEKFRNIKFDYIIFADVLEHLNNPEEVLEKVKILLNPDGHILISVPNVAHNDILLNLYYNEFNYTDTGLLDRTHIYFFTYNSLKEVCQKLNFKIINEDATYWNTFSTEQSNPSDLKPPFCDDLLERPCGNIYQFVFDLQLSEYVGNNNIHCNEIIKESILKNHINQKDELTLKLEDYYKNLLLSLNNNKKLELEIREYDSNLRLALQNLYQLKDEIKQYDENLKASIMKTNELNEQIIKYDENLKISLGNEKKLQHEIQIYDENLKILLENEKKLKENIIVYDENLRMAIDQREYFRSEVSIYDENLKIALERLNDKKNFEV